MSAKATKTKGPHYSGASSPESARAAKVGSLRLAPETWAALDAYAEREGLSRSAAVAKLVTEHAAK